MIYTHAITAVATAAVVAFGTWTVQGWRYGNMIAEMKAEHSDAVRQAEESARKAEQDLQAKASVRRKEKDRELQEIKSRHAALLDSLRDRPNQPSTEVSSVAGAGPSASWCTGARLYQDHAAAFAREAARAAELQTALKTCVGQYNDAQQKLSEVRQP
jgi:hypothetical protein